jgi:excisionase family DNA binding protein
VAQEFYNFDEALDQLNLKEEELKRLVSEGEIRAFREGETMKLRRADVETLKSELMGGDVVDLGSSGEELVFEDDLELDDTGMATEEISEMDTLLEDDVEDVGEVELEEDEDFGVEEEAAPVRRGAAAATEETQESVGMRALAILTTLVLVLGIPVAVSLSTGNTSDIAKSIAGMFATFGE